MTTLGHLVFPAGRANGKVSTLPTTLDFQTMSAQIYSAAYSMSAGASTLLTLGSPNTITAALAAWTTQDDDAHEPCSLTACRAPLHPGPCKGWKHTLHSVSPHIYKQLEEERVRKANHRRLQRIATLKAANKPIPRKLLEEIKAKPAPMHPAHGATPVPLGQVNQKADLAGGQAHHAGQAVSNAAGVKVSTASLPKGPKQKKPTVAGRGPAFVITQPKVTDQYKLDKAAKITAQEWSTLTPGDKKAIRDELAAIKVRGFGPQQKKADELLARLPAASTLGAPGANLKPGTPGTITTPSGHTYQKINLAPGKVSLGQASKTITPAPKTAPHTPAAPSAPSAPAAAKKGEKFVHTVVGPDGKTYTRTSHREYTHASVVRLSNGDKVVWGFHGSEANARATPLTSQQKKNGMAVIDALPVKREPLKKGSASAPAAPAAPSAPAAPAATPNAPAAPKVLSPDAQQARAVAGRGVPKATLAKTHLDTYGKLSKADFDSLDDRTQRTIRDDLANAKGKFLDPKKQQVAQDLLDRFGSRHTSPAPGVPAAPSGTTAMTPTNVAGLIRKNGSADLVIGGKTITTGFHGTGHEGTLTMAPGGHYVVTTSDGTKHTLAKGQMVTVSTKTSGTPAHPKGYSDPVAQAVAAATGTDNAEAIKRIGQLSHQQLDTLDAADKRAVTARLAFIASHPKADPTVKEKAQQLGRLIVTGKPAGLPKLDHEPTLNEIHAHQAKAGVHAQAKAVTAANDITMPRADRVTAMNALTKAQFDSLQPHEKRQITDSLQGIHQQNSGYGKTHDTASTMAEDAITKYTGDHPAIARAKQAEADFRAGALTADQLHTEILHAAVQAPIGPVHDRLDAEKQRIAEDNPSLPLWLRASLINNPYSGKLGRPYDVISQLSMRHSWDPAPRLSLHDFQTLFRSTDDDLKGTHPIHVEAIKAYREHIVHTGLAPGSHWSAATKSQLVDSLTGTGLAGTGYVVTDDRMKLFHDLPAADQVRVRTVLADRILSQTNNRAKTGTDITLRQLQGHPYTGDQLDAALAAIDNFPGTGVQDVYRRLDRNDFLSLSSYAQLAIGEQLDELQQRAERNGPTLTYDAQSNPLKEFPEALKEHLSGDRTTYADRRLRQASDVANYGTKIVNPYDRTRIYADVPIAQYNNMALRDQNKISADLNGIAADTNNPLPIRYGAAYTNDVGHGSKLSLDQLVAVASVDPRPGNGQSDTSVTAALNKLPKGEYDSLSKVYQDAIDERIKALPGSDQQLLTAKFHPQAAAANPSGVVPTTVQANVPPHVQEALDTIYGVHPKSHTMAHQLSTYGGLRGSDFHQLNPQEQNHLLSDLSFIHTTAKGPSAAKAKLLIDRFTPPGTPTGQVPTPAVIPPANAVPGQVRYATPLKGLEKAKDTGTSGDGWLTLPGGRRVWGHHGAAGLLIKHTDPHTGEERYLMVQRGPAISDPGKWTFPGGAIDSKETPHQGAARETLEELGLKNDQLKDALVHGDHTYSVPGSTWKYTTVAASVPSMFQPNLSTAHARAETSDAKWMTLAEIQALDKSGSLHHPIAKGLLEKNVISLYPQAGTTLGQIARPGPVTKRLGRLRMPHGGRQTPANFNAWPHAHKPSKGKNLIPDKAAFDAQRQKIKQDRALYDGKTADGRLAAIGAQQGFDDTPTVLDKKEIDRLLATGDYIEAWRGVTGAGGGWSARSRGGSGGKTAAQINEEMRSGPAYYGKGIFGNGYYLATQRRIANQYSDGTNGSIVRILIPKSALTEKYDKVSRESHANPRSSKAKGAGYGETSTFYDPGRYAAAKGIDGIEIEHHHRSPSGGAGHVASHGKPAFNWLNRSVLILQKEPG
jgi:8-oxo-dGTP pyrophosphatase MutT (NUDIX family)